MKTPPQGFVALRSLRQGTTDPTRILADIRTLYFKTTKKTIEGDLAHAVALLKMLEREDDRDKAAVYMDGLSQLRSEWAASRGASAAKGTSRAKRPRRS